MANMQASKRIRTTNTPCIVTMQKMLRGKEGILSLAQGIVHWGPPADVVSAAVAAASEPDTNSYGADEGQPDLREALMVKLRDENRLEGVDVMVTAGANQAYANLVMALLDAEDAAVLFAPFYFNHMMALQMTGGGGSVLLGERSEDFLPSIDWLERKLAEGEDGARIRMVTLVNPCNPTGVILPLELLQRFEQLCAKHSIWLVVDNTYEHFTYEAQGHPAHHCVAGEHVVNVFSFSKAFSMMGWRMGYLAFPPRLKDELMKVQDTILICPAIVSQKAALAAVRVGRAWVKERVAGLVQNRRSVIEAVETALGSGVVIGGSGAIYLMVKLPPAGADDLRVVEWLSDKHKVCVIPGSACGAPGMVRLCYANLPAEQCSEAAARLRTGLMELKERGADALAGP